MTTLWVLVVVALLFAAFSQVVAIVVALRFRRLVRKFRAIAIRFSALERTRGDARAEINRCSIRVAELEHRAGMRPKPVHVDMRTVAPVDFDEDEADDAAAASTELPPPPRTPRLGDLVEASPDDAGDDVFAGEVSVVDHVRRMVSVRARGGEVRNVQFERLRYVA